MSISDIRYLWRRSYLEGLKECAYKEGLETLSQKERHELSKYQGFNYLDYYAHRGDVFMSTSRQDFQAIARAVRESPRVTLGSQTYINLNQLLENLMRELQSLNPRFDPKRFSEACYTEEEW
jgi:hypothetical protein